MFHGRYHGICIYAICMHLDIYILYQQLCMNICDWCMVRLLLGTPREREQKSSMSAMLNNHRIPAVVRSVVRTKRTSEPRPNRDVPSPPMTVRGLEGNLTSKLATIWAFGNEIHPISSEIQDPYVILPAPRLPRLPRALSCLTSASHWLSGAASDSSCKASVTGSMLHCERFVLFATWKGKTIYRYI